MKATVKTVFSQEFIGIKESKIQNKLLEKLSQEIKDSIKSFSGDKLYMVRFEVAYSLDTNPDTGVRKMTYALRLSGG